MTFHHGLGFGWELADEFDDGSDLENQDDEFQAVDVDLVGLEACADSRRPFDVEPKLESGAKSTTCEMTGIPDGLNVGHPRDGQWDFGDPRKVGIPKGRSDLGKASFDLLGNGHSPMLGPDEMGHFASAEGVHPMSQGCRELSQKFGLIFWDQTTTFGNGIIGAELSTNGIMESKEPAAAPEAIFDTILELAQQFAGLQDGETSFCGPIVQKTQNLGHLGLCDVKLESPRVDIKTNIDTFETEGSIELVPAYRIGHT